MATPAEEGSVRDIARRFGAVVPRRSQGPAAAAAEIPAAIPVALAPADAGRERVELPPEEKAIQQSNLPRQSIIAFTNAARALGIPYLGLRAGSRQASGAAWKRVISVSKPRVYNEKGYSYNGVLGGFFPVDSELGKRDAATGRPLLIHGTSPITEGHVGYRMTTFISCIADVIESVESGTTKILKISESHLYFENSEQNKDAAREHKRIIYRLELGAMKAPSQRLQILQRLVMRLSLPMSMDKIEPHFRDLLRRHEPFSLQKLEASVQRIEEPVREEVLALADSDYEPVMVHSFASNPICSDIDTAMIPVPNYILQTANPLVSAASLLFDSAIKNEKKTLREHVEALIQFYVENQGKYPEAIEILRRVGEHAKLNYIRDFKELAIWMINNIAYKDTPGVISPFEVLYYAFVNHLNYEEMSRALTPEERTLTVPSSFTCVQHAADSNFNPTDPELLKKVGRPNNILFIQQTQDAVPIPQQQAEAKQEHPPLAPLLAHRSSRARCVIISITAR